MNQYPTIVLTGRDLIINSKGLQKKIKRLLKLDNGRYLMWI